MAAERARSTAYRTTKSARMGTQAPRRKSARARTETSRWTAANSTRRRRAETWGTSKSSRRSAAETRRMTTRTNRRCARAAKASGKRSSTGAETRSRRRSRWSGRCCPSAPGAAPSPFTLVGVADTSVRVIAGTVIRGRAVRVSITIVAVVAPGQGKQQRQDQKVAHIGLVQLVRLSTCAIHRDDMDQTFGVWLRCRPEQAMLTILRLLNGDLSLDFHGRAEWQHRHANRRASVSAPIWAIRLKDEV